MAVDMKSKVLDLIIESIGLLEVAKDSAKYNEYENFVCIFDEVIKKQESMLDLVDSL